MKRSNEQGIVLTNFLNGTKCRRNYTSLNQSRYEIMAERSEAGEMMEAFILQNYG